MNSTAAQHALNFDAPAARQAKLRGMQRVESKANPEWAAEMIRVGIQVARRLREFTTDAILEEYARDPTRPTTNNLRAMCGVVRKLQDMKIIEGTDRYENSRMISKHGCPSRVYQSLLYRETERAAA